MAENIKNVGEKDFKAAVLDAQKPVLVEIGRASCRERV